MSFLPRQDIYIVAAAAWYVVVLTIIMSFLPRQDIYIVAAAAW